MIFINHSPLCVVFGRKFKDFPMADNCRTFICSYIDPTVHKTPIKPSVAIFLIFANILASFLLLVTQVTYIRDFDNNKISADISKCEYAHRQI